MQHLVRIIRKHKYITVAIVSTLILIVICGFAAAFLAASRTDGASVGKNASHDKVPAKQKPASGQEDGATESSEKVAENATVERKQSETSTPATAGGSVPKPMATSPSPTASVSQMTPYFSVGAMGSGYTSCMYGVLYYTVYGSWIGSRVPTTQSFTWRLEVSDGTISDSGTDTMPTGSSIWHNFPSTPSDPSTLGSVVGANDGDKVRIVITSPNYAESGWSAPVPLGSEEACRNGLM